MNLPTDPRRTRRTARPPRGRSSGFTLAEVLLSGVLGAMLLTALAYATYGFSRGITHLEVYASGSEAEDALLRMMMRDIREAWWAEVPASDHLKLANPDGEYTEYWLEDSNLMLVRPGGEPEVIYPNIDTIDFVATLEERVREGDATEFLDAWYLHPVSAAPAVALEVPVGAQLALGFVTPVLGSDIPGGSGNEQVLFVAPGSMSLPLAWIHGSEPEMLRARLYESWAPGSAEPLGPMLGSGLTYDFVFADAVPTESGWEVPAPGELLNLSTLGVELEPGVGYVLVLEATGDASFVVAAHPQYPSSSVDDMALKDSLPEAEFVTLPLGMGFRIEGQYVLTVSEPVEVVTAVTVTIFPSNRPTQTRSASLLSQSMFEDPWYGVIPGQVAP